YQRDYGHSKAYRDTNRLQENLKIDRLVSVIPNAEHSYRDKDDKTGNYHRGTDQNVRSTSDRNTTQIDHLTSIPHRPNRIDIKKGDHCHGASWRRTSLGGDVHKSTDFAQVRTEQNFA